MKWYKIRKWIDLAEAEDHSGAEPEIVLAVVEAIGDLCKEVLSLQRADRKVPGDFDVDSPAGGHCEMALPSGLFDPGAGQYAAEKHLNEGCDHAMPEA